MTRPLRVLLVEDSKLDATLLLRQLEQVGYAPTAERVETATAMQTSLGRQSWDLVLCDYVLPSFSAPEALALLKASGLDVPFIIVSGQVGEETAVAAMKAGAHDYITKGNLTRLGPAIARELREAAERAARRQAEQALRESEARLRARAARFRLLVELGQTLASTHDLAVLLQLTLERATGFSGCESGSVLLRAGAEGPLELCASLGSAAVQDKRRRDASAGAAGRALRHRQPLVLYGRGVDDDGVSPAFVEPGPSSIYLPLVTTNGRAVGVLALSTAHRARPVDADDLETLQLLAAQLAAAIESAQLHERLHDLVGRLLLAHEEERRRVAYEIHDGLAQVAVGAQQHLEAFASSYRPRSPQARQQLERALALAQRTVREARRVIAGLRPTALDDFGLATAVRLEIEALGADGWGVTYDEALAGERLPPMMETALFRVAQEALTNVRKHAGPTRVHIALAHKGQAVRLEVRDWGRGFQPDADFPAGPGERVGLAGMQQRAELLGGLWTVHSRPGQGTRVVVEVPLRPQSHRSEQGESLLRPGDGQGEGRSLT